MIDISICIIPVFTFRMNISIIFKCYSQQHPMKKIIHIYSLLICSVFILNAQDEVTNSIVFNEGGIGL